MAGISKKRKAIRKNIAKRKKKRQRDVTSLVVNQRLDVDLSSFKGTRKSGARVRNRGREPLAKMLRRFRKARD